LVQPQISVSVHSAEVSTDVIQSEINILFTFEFINILPMEIYQIISGRKMRPISVIPALTL